LGLCIVREDASMTANVAIVARGTWRRWAAGIAVVLLGLVAYAVAPRAPDLAGFDPDAMARRETAMWRDYYENRYVALFRELYEVSRTEYGFSPLDSVRIAFAAASAAKTFQPTTSRATAEAALPALVDYFRLLSKGASIKVDVEDAARTELAWWQARREAVGPEQYGLIVARVATLVYGVDGADMRRSGVVRAQAMAYRDAKGEAITAGDWASIEDQLRTAYSLLKKALSSAR
jgi:hypothetical protein